jgi:NADP-dependent 3-hydroxy acid dehydrogenase YdfG
VAPFPSLVTGFQKSGLTILLKSLQNSWESSKTMVAAATTKSVDSKVKTVLVTGATSMVGKELVKELSTNTKNIRIKAAGRSEENVKRIINSDKVESIRF